MRVPPLPILSETTPAKPSSLSAAHCVTTRGAKSYLCNLCRVLSRLDEAIRLYILANFSNTAGVVIGRSVSLIGGISGDRNGQHDLFELTSEEPRMFKCCGIAFHNIGPSTANDWSSRDWLAAELALQSHDFKDSI